MTGAGSAAASGAVNENSMMCSPPSCAINCGGEPRRDHAAAVDDRDPVAKLLGLLHVVRGEYGGASLATAIADDLPHLPPRVGIEAGGRLVEKQQLRIAHQGHGHGQPLLLPAREVLDPRVRLLLQRNPGDGGRRLDAVAIESCERGSRSRDRELVGKTRFLQRDADAAANRLRIVAPPRMPRISISPAVGSSRPSSISMVVVLPAPLGPSTPKHSPFSTAKSMPRTASTGGLPA